MKLSDETITILEQHKRVLFWAKRLSYKCADKHPQWRENYEQEKAKLNQMKAERDKKVIGNDRV